MHPIRVAASTAILISVVSSIGHGQELTPGTWKGSFTVGRMPPASVEYVVPPPGDSTASFIRAQDGTETPVTAFSLNGKKLAFQWGVFACGLEIKKEGSEGNCKTTDGITGRLTLGRPVTPPQVGTNPELEHDSDVVTAAELKTSTATNLFDALRGLRSLWFQGRPQMTSYTVAALAIFVRGLPRGGQESLRDIPMESVVEVRYYNSRDGSAKFGQRYQGGVIVVTER